MVAVSLEMLLVAIIPNDLGAPAGSPLPGAQGVTLSIELRLYTAMAVGFVWEMTKEIYGSAPNEDTVAHQWGVVKAFIVRNVSIVTISPLKTPYTCSIITTSVTEPIPLVVLCCAPGLAGTGGKKVTVDGEKVWVPGSKQELIAGLKCMGIHKVAGVPLERLTKPALTTAYCRERSRIVHRQHQERKQVRTLSCELPRFDEDRQLELFAAS